MSGKGASGVSRSAAEGAGGRGDSEPKTKKQRLLAEAKQQQNESDEELYQRATSMVFGGELYAKLLGYAGLEGIRHFRGDRQWRRAMDQLPADDLQAVNLPSASRPSDLDLSLLRKLLTKPVTMLPGKKSLGWTLNDLGWKVLVGSSLTSNTMYEKIIHTEAFEPFLSSIAWNFSTSSAVIMNLLHVDTPSLYRPISLHRNATQEILSSVLLRLSHCDTLPASEIKHIYRSIASHSKVGELDLMFLARDENPLVRGAVAENRNTPKYLLRTLSSDVVESVRRGVASNMSTPQSILIALSMDSSEEVRAAVAKNGNVSASLLHALAADSEENVLEAVSRNPKVDKEILPFLVSSGREQVLFAIASRADVCVDDLFDADNKVHRSILSSKSKSEGVLETLAGLDDGEYDRDIARNMNTPPNVLGSLANSEDLQVRSFVASNKNTDVATLERLFTDGSFKHELSQNTNVPEQILASLAEDENTKVKQNVASNKSVTLETLRKMAAQNADDDDTLECIWKNRKFSFTELVRLVEEKISTGEKICDGLALAFWDRLYSDEENYLSQDLLTALSACNNSYCRYEAITFCCARRVPALHVRDIIRLSRDRELDQYGDGFLESNNVVRIAVDKLSYLLSSGGVGSYSHFADGETWW